MAGPIKAAIMLPSLTQLRVSNIDFLVFGDPLPSSSGIMADMHSRYERGIHFSVSAVTLSQRKDHDRMVTLSTEGFDNRTGNVEVIDLPTGITLFISLCRGDQFLFSLQYSIVEVPQHTELDKILTWFLRWMPSCSDSLHISRWLDTVHVDVRDGTDSIFELDLGDW